MTDNADAPASKRKILVRGINMLLMAIAFHVSWTVMIVMAIIQFVLALATDRPNDRLTAFGRNLGSYVGQLASFLTFASEEVPFPFSDWPSGEGAQSRF